MEEGRVAFTAVYLKSSHGYVGFLEELPGVNSSGRTLDEARATLQKWLHQGSLGNGPQQIQQRLA